jgi:hypothetical protein
VQRRELVVGSVSTAFPDAIQWLVADYACLPLRGQRRIRTGFPST